METLNFLPSQWQQKFIEEFVASDRQRNTLVAAIGTGKTTAVIHAAHRRLKEGRNKKLVVISDFQVRLEQWAETAKAKQIDLSLAFSEFEEDGIAFSYSDLLIDGMFNRLIKYASSGGLLVIIDDVNIHHKEAINIADRLLPENQTNQCLYVSTTPLMGSTIDWTFNIEREFFFDFQALALPETRIQIARFAPSIDLASRLYAKTNNLDDLSWRQFEIFVSKLLESDGYEIELMAGTKDNGIDIVAVKDLGEHGLFKALWQAKKYRAGRKIGIETIRELADVRNEHKASKGIIVTSSFLTSGALQRVQRDQYILGKVDRNDLTAWIDRKLFGHTS